MRDKSLLGHSQLISPEIRSLKYFVLFEVKLLGVVSCPQAPASAVHQLTWPDIPDNVKWLTISGAPAPRIPSGAWWSSQHQAGR